MISFALYMLKEMLVFVDLNGIFWVGGEGRCLYHQGIGQLKLPASVFQARLLCFQQTGRNSTGGAYPITNLKLGEASSGFLLDKGIAPFQDENEVLTT